jgi:hypothetical protein
MHVTSLRCPFAAEHVCNTPDMQGVFTLWDGDECLYVGYTPWNRSLRACLRQLLALRDEGVIRASHFAWEMTSTPKTREYQLLSRNVEKQGRLPRYNKADSPLRFTHTSVTDLHAR